MTIDVHQEVSDKYSGLNMPPFRPGWYLTNPSTRTFQYFETSTKVTAQGHFEGKDKQVFEWGSREKPKSAQWSEDYKPLDKASPGDEWDNPQNSIAKPTPGSGTTTSPNASASSGTITAIAPFVGNKTTGFLYTGVEGPSTSSASSTPSEGPSSVQPNDALAALLAAEKERQEVPWYKRAWNKTTDVVGGIGKNLGAAWSDPGQAGIGFLKGIGNTPGDLWNLAVMASKAQNGQFIHAAVMDSQAISLANEGRIAEANALASRANEMREFLHVGDLFTLDNAAQQGGSFATIAIPVGTIVKGASALAKTGKVIATAEDISKVAKTISAEEKIAQGLSTADKVEDLSKAQGVVKGEELASKGALISKFTRKFPLGFASEKQYQQAMKELEDALRKSGIDDAKLGTRGSAVSGQSSKGGSFRVGGENASDIDVFIESNKLTNNASLSKNIPGFMHPDKVMKAFPELRSWSERWSTILDRSIAPGGFKPGNVPTDSPILHFP